MEKLQTIIQNHDIILLDGSLNDLRRDICKEIYEATYWNELNNNELRQSIFYVNEFIKILEHEKINTIPEMANELKNFQRILGEKIVYLKKNEKQPKSKKKRKSFEKSSSSKENLIELQKITHNSYYIAKNKSINIKDPGFNILLNLVKKVESTLNLKRDTSYLKGETSYDNSHNSDTDEKIITTLYWQSMFTNKKSCVLTADGDIPEMLLKCSAILGSKIFIPYNSLFRERLHKNYINCYFSREINTYKETSTKDIYFWDLNSKKNQKTQNMKIELQTLWKKFNK